MKEYPVTSRELWTLGSLQAGSAAALSLGGWLFGFWMNVKQAVDFAGKDTPTAIINQWQAYSDMAFWASIAAAALGGILLGLSGLNVWGIIKDTTHA